jgi:hypothetical protein
MAARRTSKVAARQQAKSPFGKGKGTTTAARARQAARGGKGVKPGQVKTPKPGLNTSPGFPQNTAPGLPQSSSFNPSAIQSLIQQAIARRGGLGAIPGARGGPVGPAGVSGQRIQNPGQPAGAFGRMLRQSLQRGGRGLGAGLPQPGGGLPGGPFGGMDIRQLAALQAAGRQQGQQPQASPFQFNNGQLQALGQIALAGTPLAGAFGPNEGFRPQTNAGNVAAQQQQAFQRPRVGPAGVSGQRAPNLGRPIGAFGAQLGRNLRRFGR